MPDVSLLRLYLLRVTYAIVAFGLGREIWPVLIAHSKPWTLMHGVALCMLATVSALALIGIL